MTDDDAQRPHSAFGAGRPEANAGEAAHLLEQRAAAEALRESEEKYRSLFEEMDEGFAVCELVRDAAGHAVDFRYIDLNPAVLRHTGIGLETLRGRRATEAFPQRDRWFLETYAHVVESGRSVLEEHYFEHVDRWLRINVFPRGGDRFAVLYSDITDRKRVETVLREREQRQGFLLRFTDAIRSEPNEQALIKRAVQMLAEELAVDRAYATRHFPDKDLTKVVHEVRGSGLEPLPATLRFSDFPEAGRQTFERTLIFEDTANDQTLTEADKAALASMNVGALLSRPLRRDGSPIFALGVVGTLPRRWTPAEVALVEEATERTWEAAERARAEAAVRESEEKYAALFGASPAPFLILRPDAPDFTIADVNDAYLAATMRTRENLVGRAMFDAFPDNPDDAAANGVSNLRASLQRALLSRRFVLMDVQKYDIVRPDGTFEERWWKPANAPVVDANGKVVAIIHHVADVTSEHRAVEGLRASEQHAQTLLAELQHRVRNILAMMRSVVRRTSRSKTDLGDFVQHLEGRIDAMARTQALLTRVPGKNVNLEDVVRDELVAQAAEDRKVAIDGPEVGLSPHAAEIVTLALHELATNSVKYGALGNGDGRVNVSWGCPSHDGKQTLQLTWQETGLKNGASNSPGFGTELITERVPYELHGRGELKIADGTLTAMIEFPLERGSSILETQPSR